jgi:hypothetical protein
MHAIKYSFDCLCSGNVEGTATTLQVQLPACSALNSFFFFVFFFFFGAEISTAGHLTWLPVVLEANWYNYNHKARTEVCAPYINPKLAYKMILWLAISTEIWHFI